MRVNTSSGGERGEETEKVQAWIRADIFPSIDKYELEAKHWVYLWKQTGPYISLGITEISCINTDPPTAASHLKWETIESVQRPLCAFEQTWGERHCHSAKWESYGLVKWPISNQHSCEGKIKKSTLLVKSFRTPIFFQLFFFYLHISVSPSLLNKA